MTNKFYVVSMRDFFTHNPPTNHLVLLPEDDFDRIVIWRFNTPTFELRYVAGPFSDADNLDEIAAQHKVGDSNNFS